MKDMTALVKKYQDQEEFPRMIGTEGGMDYLIVAKDEKAGVQLGIKPLIGMGQIEGKASILLGFRLRSAYIPGGNVADMDSEENEKGEVHTVWDFPWENVGITHTGMRASLIRTIALARDKSEAGWAFDDLDHIRFFGKVQQFLHDRVSNEQFVVTDDDVADYLRASYYAPLLAMQAQAGDPRKQLELLDHQWEVMVKNHEKAKEAYESKRAELLEKIEALEAESEPTYQPKAHFADEELIPMDSVAHAMLQGAKPKLSVISNDDEGSADEGSGGTTFDSTDEEPDAPELSGDGSNHEEGPTAENGDEPPAAA